MGGLGKGMGKGWGKGMGKCWGKGMGKCWGNAMSDGKGEGKGEILSQMLANVVQMCKGKGKGKGKCRNNGSSDEPETAQIDVQPRPCAREGCMFSATWHSTHCCGGCSKFPGHHGGRCQQIPFSDVAPEPSNDMEGEEQHQTLQDSGDKPCFDFTFPVVVEDGRNLTISWNRVDDADQVAASFAHQHSIPHEEIATIKAFLLDAVAMLQAGKEKEDGGETDLKDAQKQLAEMGLGDGEVLLDLLKRHGGSVQRVIEELTMEEQ